MWATAAAEVLKDLRGFWEQPDWKMHVTDEDGSPKFDSKISKYWYRYGQGAENVTTER